MLKQKESLYRLNYELIYKEKRVSVMTKKEHSSEQKSEFMSFDFGGLEEPIVGRPKAAKSIQNATSELGELGKQPEDSLRLSSLLNDKEQVILT